MFSSVLKDFFPNSNIFARRVRYFPTVCDQDYAKLQQGFFSDIGEKLYNQRRNYIYKELIESWKLCLSLCSCKLYSKCSCNSDFITLGLWRFYTNFGISNTAVNMFYFYRPKSKAIF